MTTQTQRVLPADVYDTLEFSSLAFGGIGGGYLTEEQRRGEYDSSPASATPFCVIGHAGVATQASYWFNPITEALNKAFLSIPAVENNLAVKKINERRHAKDDRARVTFRQWCKELGVVRGDA